ncbi:MAG: DUF4177 domain-containing protein [Gemmataceae bacterium]
MKWEYKVVYIVTTKWTSTGLPTDLGESFDQWGNEGWELVKIEPIHAGGWFLFFFGTFTRTDAFVAFFKRQKT